MTFVRVGFGDEYSFYASEQAEFLARNRMANSARWVSFDPDAKLDQLKGLEIEVLNLKLTELRGQGKLKHVTELNDGEVERYRDIFGEAGVLSFDVGSGVGKDPLDGPGWKIGLWKKVENTIRTAKKIGARRVRIFNGYVQHTDGEDIEYRRAWDASLNEFTAIAEAFATEGLVGFFENEAGKLLGATGPELVQYWRVLDKPNMLLYFDGANLVRIDPEETNLAFRSFLDMEPGLGGFHLKDCPHHKIKGGKSVEHALYPHVAVGKGAAGYDRIFIHLMEGKGRVAAIEDRLEAAGLTRQIALIHEPHRIYQSNVGGISQDRYQDSVDVGDRLFEAAGMPVQEFQKE
jgi:sugar phosphate isomerase/epimerase